MQKHSCLPDYSSVDSTQILTFDMQGHSFAPDWRGVDGAPVLILVFPPHISDLKIPFFDVGTHNAEAPVIDDTSVLIGQGARLAVQPGHLQQGHRERLIMCICKPGHLQQGHRERLKMCMCKPGQLQ